MIHNSETYTAGFNGKRCEMCQFAEEVDTESPYKTPSRENQPAGFLVPEPKNVPQGQETPETTLCRACQGSGADDGLAGVCSYCHGSGQVETYGNPGRAGQRPTPSSK